MAWVRIQGLCMAVLVLVLSGNVASAQISLSLPDTSINAGTSLSIPIRVTGFNHVGSFSITITFDNTVLTYTGYANQPSFGSFFSTPTATANSNGSIGLSWFNASRALNIGSGTLLNIQFVYGSGSSALTFANIIPSSITDSLASNLPASFTNGRVRLAGSILPPSPPTLASPSNGAINQSTSTTLSWFTATGATAYHLQVSTSFGFGTNVFDDSTLSTTLRTVSSLALNTSYFWRVRSRNTAGYSAFSETRSFTTVRTTHVETSDGLIPKGFALDQNYPNPFNPSTTIQFSLPAASQVSLKIFDLLGKEMLTIVSERLGPGVYTVPWQASVPSGVYFYQLRAGNLVETKKMLLAK
jgi:hypothetical protein